MREKYSFLSKNIVLFMLGGFIPKILAFILIPLYTGILTTREYGIADLITTTVTLLIPIFTLDIQDAVMRYALDNKYKKTEVFSAGVQIILKGFILILVGAGGLNLINFKELRKEYVVFAILTYFFTALYNSISLFCRGIEKVKTIIVGSILCSSISLLANIFFLAILHWGLFGYLLANFIGYAITVIFIIINAKLYRYINFHINKSLQKEMIRFSFPLIFSVIAWWINNASDRYILSWVVGVPASGVFAVAYKIPNLLSTFQNVFAQAWSISAIKEYDSDDNDGFIGNMFTFMNFAMVSCCSTIMIVNIPVARILYSKEFFIAWKFVPPLLISVVFNAMALFIGSIFTALKDTRTLAKSTIIGAVVNIILNIILINSFSTYGAAIATMLGYGVTYLIRHIILRKHIKMKINWHRDIFSYIILVIQMIVAAFGLKLLLLQVVLLFTILLIYNKEIRKVCYLFINRINSYLKIMGK